MARVRFLIWAVVLLVLAAPVMASGGDTNIFAGNVGYAFWAVVIFVLVFVVLGKFAWGPLLGTLQQREDFIRESLEKAKADREDAEARLAEYEERLTSARAEATAIVEEGRRDAEVLRRRIEQEARQEARRESDRAKREIGIARDTAIKELYTVSGNLAVDIASRIVGRELKARDHKRLIDEAIDQVSEARQELTH